MRHIVSTEDGGCSTEDNAILLCEICFASYGDDPSQRRFLRERRDSWDEACARTDVPLELTDTDSVRLSPSEQPDAEVSDSKPNVSAQAASTAPKKSAGRSRKTSRATSGAAGRQRAM